MTDTTNKNCFVHIYMPAEGTGTSRYWKYFGTHWYAYSQNLIRPELSVATIMCIEKKEVFGTSSSYMNPARHARHLTDCSGKKWRMEEKGCLPGLPKKKSHGVLKIVSLDRLIQLLWN